MRRGVGVCSVRVSVVIHCLSRISIKLNMLRIIAVASLMALASSAPGPAPANVFEIDISPEEAQRYLSSPPFTAPQLSARTAVLPLVRWNDPSFRSAEAGPTLGHYWKNGHEIENTNDYVEEVYNAAQFHGQDGLGAYAYGYQAPESSKVENRAASGDVTGSYTYKDGNNNDILVRYWADSEGFHQEDNLPKVLPEPVQETEEVRQARVAHQQAWEEAAAAAAQQPDPEGDYNPQEYEGSASEQQSSVVGGPQQARDGKQLFASAQSSYQSPQYKSQGQFSQTYQGQQGQAQNQQPQYQGQAQNQQSQYQGQAQNQQPQYQGQAQKPQYQGQQSQYQGQQSQYQGQQSQYSQGQQSQGQKKPQQANDEENEPTGPPRGFFYSYTYPVSVLVAKNAGEGGQAQPGHPVDHDTVAVGAQQRG